MDYLRPHLQPITHNLPAPLRTLGVSLLGPACYTTLLLDLSLTPSPCLSLAVSKTLGLAIIAASSVVKIPQILKLLQSQSAAGVSFVAYVLEIAADVVGVTYNARGGNPFSTYGESALILAQNVVVAALVLRFSGRGGVVVGGFVVGLGVVAWVLQVVGWEWLKVAQVGAGVAGVVSKAPQIWTVWKQGGTGQLSAFAVLNYLLGSLMRIFTTLQEVDDKVILSSFIAGFLLNSILFAQVLYYWNNSSTVTTTVANHGREMGKGSKKVGMGSSSTEVAGKAKSPSTRRRG